METSVYSRLAASLVRMGCLVTGIAAGEEKSTKDGDDRSLRVVSCAVVEDRDWRMNGLPTSNEGQEGFSIDDRGHWTQLPFCIASQDSHREEEECCRVSLIGVSSTKSVSVSRVAGAV